MKKRLVAVILLTLLINQSTAVENVRYKWGFSADNNIRAVAFYEADNATQNIVIGSGNKLFILDNKGGVIGNYTIDTPGSVYTISVADIDYDDIDEVLIGVGWIETKDLNETHIITDRSGVSFSKKIVYRTSKNRGSVYVLDNGKLEKMFDAGGWVRSINVDTLFSGEYSEWRKSIVVTAGGINHLYYRERLPSTTYERSCVPNVRKSTDRNNSETYRVEVIRVGDTLDTCRHDETCAPEIKSYHGKPDFYEDCCTSSPGAKACCDRNDSSCNGTYAYSSEKQCIYIPESWGGLIVWDPDVDEPGIIDNWGCYKVLRWDCSNLECHKLGMQFKTDTFYSSVISIYDPKGNLVKEVDVTNLTFSECTFNSLDDYARKSIVSDFIPSIPGKEIIFNTGTYLFMLNKELERIVGLFPGCDYLKNEYYDVGEMRDVGDFMIYDIDADNEEEILMLYPYIGELQVIDKRYNWAEGGECREEFNKSLGVNVRVYTVPHSSYTSPDWTFRVPLTKEVEYAYMARLRPYNYSQIMVISDEGISAIMYGVHESTMIYNSSEIDGAYFSDIDNNNVEDIVITDRKRMSVYELSQDFLKDRSANMKYERALYYAEQDPYKAREDVIEAMQLYHELGNTEGVDNANKLLEKINGNIARNIRSKANDEYAAALVNYRYHNELAKKYAENASKLYASVDDIDSVFKCEELIEKINKMLYKPATTVSTSTTEEVTTSTINPVQRIDEDVWYMLTGAVVLVIIFLSIHSIAKRYSRKQKTKRKISELKEKEIEKGSSQKERREEIE